MAGPSVITRGLTKYFDNGETKDAVINDVDVEIHSGKMTAILGPSGSGKSTLLNLIGLLLSPDEGELIVAGVSVGNLTNSQRAVFRLRNIGFVFQSFQLIDHKTVRQNIELPLRYLGVQHAERQTRVDELLHDLGLWHRRDSYPATLSGGEKQRTAIARAVVSKPKILLCDEPTGSLDSNNSAAVLELLARLTTPETTTLIVTHDPVVAAACEQTIRVADGRVDGTGLHQDAAETAPVSTGRAEETKRRRSRGKWIRSGIAEACRSIIPRLNRNLFTSLGVSIGIATLVLTIGLSATISAQLSDKFNAFLAQRVTVTDQTLAGILPGPLVDLDASYNLAQVRNLNGVKAAGLITIDNSGTTVALHAGAQSDGMPPQTVSAPIVSASVQALGAMDVDLLRGRFFDQGHVAGGGVCLAGTGVLSQLGRDWVPGMMIYLGGESCSVIGEIDDKDPAGSYFSSVVVPLGNDYSSNDSPYFEPELLIKVHPGAATQVGHEAPLVFNPARPDSVTVSIPPEPETLRQSVDAQQSTLLLAMALITLVIGSIGVMNTFLVSVMERRREIGLKMALGSSKQGIIAQFATEAVAVALIGSVIGILLGLNTLTLLAVINRWVPVIDPLWIGAGLLSGLVVGAVAGIYPAVKAARIDPITSLTQV